MTETKCTQNMKDKNIYLARVQTLFSYNYFFNFQIRKVQVFNYKFQVYKFKLILF